jgi:hypothetical protein
LADCQSLPNGRFLATYQVNDFLSSLSYFELLAFLPDDPNMTPTLLQNVRPHVLLMLRDDPTAFLFNDDERYESSEDSLGSREGGLWYGCNFDYFDRIAQFSYSQVRAYDTADSGSDTNVLGKEWLVISTGPIGSFRFVKGIPIPSNG